VHRAAADFLVRASDLGQLSAVQHAEQRHTKELGHAWLVASSGALSW
jgi:hypothetical protein